MYRTFKWYYKERNILLLLVVAPPIGLYLMYKYTDWRIEGKYVITAIHTALFLTLSSLMIWWIVTTDFFDEGTPQTATMYECSPSSAATCLTTAISNDITSLGSTIPYEVLLHRSTTMAYPEKALEIEIEYSPEDNNKAVYEKMTAKVMNDISISELNRLSYKHVVVTYHGTIYDDGTPSNERLLVYSFSVINLILSDNNNIKQSAISNYEEYVSSFFTD